jgi:transcriptional regulator with XRE-family HTH domain
MEQQTTLDYDNIGKRIYGLRKEKKLSQMKLAELVDLSKNSISNIELGKQQCRTDKLLEFANVLETTLDYLMYGGDNTGLGDVNIENQMLQEFRKMSMIDQKRFLAMARSFNVLG